MRRIRQDTAGEASGRRAAQRRPRHGARPGRRLSPLRPTAEPERTSRCQAKEAPSPARTNCHQLRQPPGHPAKTSRIQPFSCSSVTKIGLSEIRIGGSEITISPRNHAPGASFCVPQMAFLIDSDSTRAERGQARVLLPAELADGRPSARTSIEIRPSARATDTESLLRHVLAAPERLFRRCAPPSPAGQGLADCGPATLPCMVPQTQRERAIQETAGTLPAAGRTAKRRKLRWIGPPSMRDPSAATDHGPQGYGGPGRMIMTPLLGIDVSKDSLSCALLGDGLKWLWKGAVAGGAGVQAVEEPLAGVEVAGHERGAGTPLAAGQDAVRVAPARLPGSRRGVFPLGVPFAAGYRWNCQVTACRRER